MTANALFYYAIGLWAFSGVKIVVSAFYALQDTVTPVKVSVITFFSYIIFGVILMGPLKHGGLALALSLSSALNFTLLVFLLKRKLPEWKLSPISLSVLKVLLSAAVMGISVFYLKVKFFTYDYDPGVFNLASEVFFLVISGIVIYLISASIFRCGELKAIAELIKSKK